MKFQKCKELADKIPLVNCFIFHLTSSFWMKITDFFSVKLANKLHIVKTSSGSFWSFLLLFYNCKRATPLSSLFTMPYKSVLNSCQRQHNCISMSKKRFLTLYHRTSTMQRYDISRALWEMVRNSVCSVSAAHLSSPCRGGTGAALRPREVLADGIRGVRLRFVRRGGHHLLQWFLLLPCNSPGGVLR